MNNTWKEDSAHYAYRPRTADRERRETQKSVVQFLGVWAAITCGGVLIEAVGPLFSQTWDGFPLYVWPILGLALTAWMYAGEGVGNIYEPHR